MSDADIKGELNELLELQKKADERYGKLVPDSEDISLVVLKGHLIVEEILYGLLREHCGRPQYLDRARLSFYQLAWVLRALVRLPLVDSAWDAIMTLNGLRNKLAHNLEPRNLDIYVSRLRRVYATAETEPTEESPAKVVRYAIFYVVGQLSIVTTVTRFLERRVKIDMGSSQPDQSPDQ